MNNMRRKALSEVFDALEELKGTLEDLTYEEQECYDNIPESFQNGERAENMLTIIGYLEEAADALDTATENIQSAIE